MLLASSVEILQPGWLDCLQETALSGDNVGIVGCRLRLPDGRLLQAGAFVLPDAGRALPIGSLERDVNQYARDREVHSVSLSAAYIRRDVLDAIGSPFHANGASLRDTDYCLAARQAGYKTFCCGSVTMVCKPTDQLVHRRGTTPQTLRPAQSDPCKKWQLFLEQRYTSSVAWQSILNFPTGYAMSCRELLRTLDAEGVRVSYSYVYGPGTVQPIQEPVIVGDDLLRVISQRTQEDRPAVSVVFGQGDVFHRSIGRYRIGYTMLEVDGFPSEWVRQANEMDEVWVPSSFNRETFSASGLTRPIHVMPLGVDVDHFHPAIHPFRNPRREFVFLANFEWGERKAPDLLLTAFNETFRRDEPVVLLCKVSNRDPDLSIREAVLRLGLRGPGGRIAFISNRDMPYSQLGCLYRSADCYVAATRGEGWNMPLMEAMACGLPAIATDWSAHLDFIDESVAYPLRVRQVVRAVARKPVYAGFSWADPDPEHLRALLRHVFEHQDEARDKGRRAAERVGHRWTSTHAAHRIRERLAVITSETGSLR
ncbi:MAG: glycosyltransferase [Methylacidiphilaceae bacterium]|nr:glycosyltransferase [Candidatus Methylacidiphilaceae bacterium]